MQKSGLTEIIPLISPQLCGRFPSGSEVKVSACNAGDYGSIPVLGRFPWRRKWQPTPVFLPGESHGWRSPVGSSPRGHKELDTTERLHFHFQLCGASILCFHILSSLRAHQLTIIPADCDIFCFLIQQEILHCSLLLIKIHSLEFTLCVVSFISSDNCIMACMHYCNMIQNSFVR